VQNRVATHARATGSVMITTLPDWADWDTRDISSNGQLPPPKNAARRPRSPQASISATWPGAGDCDDRNRSRDDVAEALSVTGGMIRSLLTPYTHVRAGDPDRRRLTRVSPKGPQETGLSLRSNGSFDRPRHWLHIGWCGDLALCTNRASRTATARHRAGGGANMSRMGSVRSNRPCGATRNETLHQVWPDRCDIRRECADR